MRIATIFLLLFGASLSAQQQFTNNGNLKICPGTTVSVFGDFVNNGTMTDSADVIVFRGSSAQKMEGTGATVFNNLTLSNPSGVYLGADQSIRGELTISAGTFTTTGYNFTLISDINGTARIAPILGDIQGNITMQRYIGAGATGWRFLASPVKGVTINDWQDDFVTSGFPGSLYPAFSFTSVYSYDETAQGSYDLGYVSPNSAGDSIKPGSGFWCYIGPAPLTIDVTGPPAKFSHTFNVSYTSGTGPIDDGWQMIGNPYPSTIDWDSPNWTKTNINSAIYIWNPQNQQFASWVGGTGVNGGSNLIASSQSFWIQTNGANPVLACDENIKSSNDRAFLKPANQFASKLVFKMSGNGYSDETLIRFGNATGAYDVESDARKAYSSNPAAPGLCSLDPMKNEMSINSLPPITGDLYIPLKALVGVSGVYTLSLDSTSSFPPNSCLLLEDLTTGHFSYLTPASFYSFTIADTTQSPRFVIRIYSSGDATGINASCNKASDGKIIATAKGLGPWNYVWRDGSSNLLKSTLNALGPDTLSLLPPGIYSVEISSLSGYCSDTKTTMLISEPVPVVASFSLLKDSIIPGEKIILNNTSQGSVNYSWDFGDGATDTTFSPSNHQYLNSGRYRIVLTARNNSCTDTISREVTVLNLNALHKNTPLFPGDVQLFPNPTNGVFYINLTTLPQGTSIELFTPNGIKVLEKELKTLTTQIDMKEYARGVYFYRIHHTQGHNLTGKIVFQ